MGTRDVETRGGGDERVREAGGREDDRCGGKERKDKDVKNKKLS